MPNFQNLQNCQIFGPIIHFMDTKFYNKWFGPKNTIFGITNIYQASQIYQSLKFKRFLVLKILKVKRFSKSVEFIFWASKSCAMIGLSPEDSDLFELKSGRIYGEKGGLAAVGGLAAPF